MWDDTSLPDYRMKKCLSITPQRKKITEGIVELA